MLNIMDSKLAHNPQAWENGAKYWSKRIPKLQNKERVTEGEISHIQNQIANISNTILNDKLQYDSTTGGNVYDSSAAQAYYMAQKRGKYRDKNLRNKEKYYDSVESTLNTQLNNAEYYEEYDTQKAQQLRQESEQHTSEWISIIMGVIGIIAMFI